MHESTACFPIFSKFSSHLFFFFFFNDTATTEIYTLSLHDALPISDHARPHGLVLRDVAPALPRGRRRADRKSTRLNSSHDQISYAVFCLKKKKNNHFLETDAGRNSCVLGVDFADHTQRAVECCVRR